MLKELAIGLTAGAVSASIIIYYINNKNTNDHEWFKQLLEKNYKQIESFYNEQKKRFNKEKEDNEIKEQLNQALNSPSPPNETQNNNDFTNVEHSDAVEQPKRSTSMASFFDSIKLSQLRS
jgi:hypothetical protein